MFVSSLQIILDNEIRKFAQCSYLRSIEQVHFVICYAYT